MRRSSPVSTELSDFMQRKRKFDTITPAATPCHIPNHLNHSDHSNDSMDPQHASQAVTPFCFVSALDVALGQQIHMVRFDSAN